MLKEKIESLYGKDLKEEYNVLLELEEISKSTDELYPYFDEFVNMLASDKSYIRVRGFRLICSQAKWDKLNKINQNMALILNELDDEKPTALRQCLKSLRMLVEYKKELRDCIKEKLERKDYVRYKDTMQGLIKKDVEEILKNI